MGVRRRRCRRRGGLADAVMEEAADRLAASPPAVAGHQRRQVDARLEAVRAARREGAAGRDVAEPRHGALDRPQPRAVLARQRRQQAARVGVLRVAEQRPHRRLFDDAAGVHHGDAIRLLRDDAEVVGDEQQREAEARLQIAQQVEDLALDRDVERGRRLVGDEQLGLAGERRGDQRALAQAAGQLVRVFVDAALRIRDADRVAAARWRGRAPPGREPGRAPRAPRRSGCRRCRRD